MVKYPVTVIIAARDMGETLEQAARSALDAGAHEVLVFDDGSTDSTVAVMRRLLELPAVRGYTLGAFRSGPVFARNFLIDRAAHDLIVPLDADDELIDVAALADAYTPGVWVYGHWLESTADSAPAPVAAPPPGMLRQKPICHATMLFSKLDWQRVGGYDPDFFFGEDYAFQCALTAAGIRPVRVEAETYLRRVRASSRTDAARRYWPVILDLVRSKYGSVVYA